MTGRQLPGVPVDRARLRDVAEGEIVLDRERVHLAAKTRVRHERLELRAEDELAISQERVMERLDAEPVAREEQRLAVLVPQRESEHAAEALDARGTPRFPGVHDRLGVALGMEHVPEARKLRNDGLKVVNLAVEHHNDGAILVVERLLASSQVDNGKPPV